MFTGILKRFLKISAAVAVGASVLLVASNAQAANCSINTVPSPANISAGGSVDFDANVS